MILFCLVIFNALFESLSIALILPVLEIAILKDSSSLSSRLLDYEIINSSLIPIEIILIVFTVVILLKGIFSLITTSYNIWFSNNIVNN